MITAATEKEVIKLSITSFDVVFIVDRIEQVKDGFAAGC